MDRNINHADKAVQYFLGGYNCAQSVFTAFCDVTGLTEESALMLSSPLGGGMGRMREVCGAVSAMLLVLGSEKGYSEPDDEIKKALYEKVQQLAGIFKEKHGTIICRELLDNPPSNPEPSERTPEYYKDRPCARFVHDAAEIIENELKNL